MPLDGKFRKDLQWFNHLAHSFNGTTTFANWAGSHDGEVHINASLRGLGAVWDSHFYSVALPVFVTSQNRIVVFAMLNLLVAIRTWGQLWRDKKILLCCDNRAVVDVMFRSKTCDTELGAILREILMVQAKLNIQLEVKHVRGTSNPVADALSRVHMFKSVECKETLARRVTLRTL